MSKAVQTGSNIGGPALGNGIAYFLLWYVGREYGYTFDDPELALAMGGAVVASFLLEIRKLFGFVGRIFNRMFPEKPDA